MNVLDLFSGIGGFSLGLERAGMRTVAFCEIEPYCRAVLRKHWPGVPIFEDVRTLTAEQVGPVDVICGGYPCQPFSLAGERLGAADDRHLWPEYRRLVEALRPAWVIGENVAGHINMGLDNVLSDLEALGYACRPFVIPACAVDAKHRRDRVWIVAHTEHGRLSVGRGIETVIGSIGRQAGISSDVASCLQQQAGTFLADAHYAGREQQWWQVAMRPELVATEPGSWWGTEPDVGRVAYGVPNRVDRLRALGNAVVPQIPEIIGRAIMNAEQIK
jgi:DNA (cytosine-5)-methyltransferase 1